MPENPDNLKPDSEELPEEEADLLEEPEQIWPPPSDTGKHPQEPSKLQAGSLDTGWSQEVHKIDEAIEQIRRINGHAPQEDQDSDEGPESHYIDIEADMGGFGTGLAGEIDKEIDEEIAEVLRGGEAEPLEPEDEEIELLHIEPPEPIVTPPLPPPLVTPVASPPPSVTPIISPPPAEIALEIPAVPDHKETLEAFEPIVCSAKTTDSSIPESDVEALEVFEEIEDLEEIEKIPTQIAGDEEPVVTVEPPDRDAVEDMVAAVVQPGPTTRVKPTTARVSEAKVMVREKSELEINQLWGNIFFSADRQAPRGIIVTAARRRDGASQIAASLALIGAEVSREKSVILVDFNLRNPGLADVLEIPTEPGVTDILDGRVELEAAIQTVRLKNGNQLYVLPAGPPVEKPLGLLKSRQTQSLIGQLLQRYDHTIIDVTAANAHPDPQVLGALVDGALLVLRAGDTPRETVAEAKKRLDLAGVRCLGTVLNQRTDPIPGFVYRRT